MKHFRRHLQWFTINTCKKGKVDPKDVEYAHPRTTRSHPPFSSFRRVPLQSISRDIRIEEQAQKTKNLLSRRSKKKHSDFLY